MSTKCQSIQICICICRKMIFITHQFWVLLFRYFVFILFYYKAIVACIWVIDLLHLLNRCESATLSATRYCRIFQLLIAVIESITDSLLCFYTSLLSSNYSYSTIAHFQFKTTIYWFLLLIILTVYLKLKDTHMPNQKNCSAEHALGIADVYWNWLFVSLFSNMVFGYKLYGEADNGNIFSAWFRVWKISIS